MPERAHGRRLSCHASACPARCFLRRLAAICGNRGNCREAPGRRIASGRRSEGSPQNLQPHYLALTQAERKQGTNGIGLKAMNKADDRSAAPGHDPRQMSPGIRSAGQIRRSAGIALLERPVLPFPAAKSPCARN